MNKFLWVVASIVVFLVLKVIHVLNLVAWWIMDKWIRFSNCVTNFGGFVIKKLEVSDGNQ